MKIVSIYIGPEHNYVGHHGQPPGLSPTVRCAEVECVAGKGIKGDRYFGWKDDYKGQVTFFAEETWERLCQQMAVTDKDAGVFRRNVITRGVDLNTLIGKEFEVQGVRFLGTQEAAPCHWMNEAFGPGAEAALQGYGGLRAKILTDGILRVDA
ncbi:MAG: molybdenum cofactor biosysynthesis protein [Verrucomicrobiaceae bacterium]|nr:molybdenum cofactor biosysynthesis protein [Verrucomicrobiaceae bacterium]